MARATSGDYDSRSRSSNSGIRRRVVVRRCVGCGGAVCCLTDASSTSGAAGLPLVLSCSPFACSSRRRRRRRRLAFFRFLGQRLSANRAAAAERYNSSRSSAAAASDGESRCVLVAISPFLLSSLSLSCLSVPRLRLELHSCVCVWLRQADPDPPPAGLVSALRGLSCTVNRVRSSSSVGSVCTTWATKWNGS